MNATFKTLFLFSLLFLTVPVFAQKTTGDFFVFNADWSPAKSFENCTYFMQKIKESDTEYICRYYHKLGPMIKQETYKDNDLSVPNGRFCWYNEKGKIDSCGKVINFKKDGEWDYFFGDSTNPTYYQDYNNGKFIKQSTFNLNDTSKKDQEDVTQKAAAFPNGSKGWIQFLEKNLITPDRLMKTFGRGMFTATACFLIDKQGKIEDLYLRKSIEWSADAEVFEIFSKSPLWVPAVQQGKPVVFRQLQNINFRIN